HAHSPGRQVGAVPDSVAGIEFFLAGLDEANFLVPQAARVSTSASYSCCDAPGSSTHIVYTPIAVPNGILNSEMNDSTSVTTRTQGSRCSNPQPAKNPHAALTRTMRPSVVTSALRNPVGTSGGAPISCKCANKVLPR